MRLVLLLALASWPSVAAAQTDPRLSACLGFAPRMEERLARCNTLATDGALPIALRERADRHATRLMIAMNDWGGMLRSAEARLAANPADTAALDRRILAVVVRNDDRPRALSLVDEALAAHPGDVELQITRSLILLGLRRPDEALAQVTRALAAAPGNVDGLRARALARGMKGEGPAALAEIESALAAAPDDVVLLRTRAHMLTALNRFPEAITVLDRIIALAPEHRGMNAIRGLLNGELGNRAAAIADLTEAIRLDPEPAESYEGRGRIRQLSGDAAGALSDYDEALRLEPRRAVSLTNRAVLHLEAGRFAPAAADAREAIRLDPRDVNPRITLARAVRDGDRDLPRALTLFNEALTIDPASGPANNAKGVTLLRLGRGREAVLAFDTALIAEPANRLYLANRGEGYYIQEQYADAMSDFSRAITLGLRNAGTYLLRGMVHLRNKDYRAAEADAETAIQLNSALGPARALRAALSVRAGNPHDMIVEADRALALQPDNLMALNVKAFALERLERRGEANEVLRRASAIGGRGQQTARAMVLELAR
jgi:tetratricopeptide (TPR) repeat protein